jgi:hypothetical protein
VRYEPHRSCFAIDAVHCVHRILRADWQSIGWDQCNKPTNKDDQLKYTELRQCNPSDPYGYRSPTGGEVVLHPADKDHSCPHYHAKRKLSDKSVVFPFDPAKQ